MSSRSLRERGKARRHSEIVDAAAALWRKRGIENVSLGQIAAAAEVAPQTVYNLIGGLDAICFAVIKLALDRLDDALTSTAFVGIERALETAQMAAELYLDDARLYRQVLVRIPRVLFDGTHLGRDVAQISISAVREAQRRGELVDVVDPGRLGRTIHTNFTGALYDWACGDMADDRFRAAARIAVLTPLAACASESRRLDLRERLIDALRPA